jgi:hypothetical protein
VVLLPPTGRQPIQQTSNTTSRCSERRSNAQQQHADVVRRDQLNLPIVVVQQVTSLQVHNDDLADQKNKYEGEAEKSDMDESFIDDEEESNDEARELTRSTCAALRNRRSWKETES